MCKIIKSENADKKFHNLSSIFLIWNIDDKEIFLLGCHHLRARPLRRADLRSLLSSSVGDHSQERGPQGPSHLFRSDIII